MAEPIARKLLVVGGTGLLGKPKAKFKLFFFERFQ